MSVEEDDDELPAALGCGTSRGAPTRGATIDSSIPSLCCGFGTTLEPIDPMNQVNTDLNRRSKSIAKGARLMSFGGSGDLSNN